jgi:hypothetical protein
MSQRARRQWRRSLRAGGARYARRPQTPAEISLKQKMRDLNAEVLRFVSNLGHASTQETRNFSK